MGYDRVSVEYCGGDDLRLGEDQRPDHEAGRVVRESISDFEHR